MKRPNLVVVALAAMIAAAALAAWGGGERGQASDELAARLQEILDGAIESRETVFPGTALYVSHPELGTWAGAAGEGNIDPAAPMRATDSFRAGSIMKPFVAAAVLQLVEKGELSLDDPLPALLPEGVVARFADADQITLRMLLDHTSGLPDYVTEVPGAVAADPQRVWEVEELLDLAAAHQRPHAPGAGWAYSNTNYNLLGLVIEEATGESWREIVRERVIDRLGLESTSLPEPGTVSVDSDDAHGCYPLGTLLYGVAVDAAGLSPSLAVLEGGLVDVTGVDSSLAGAAGANALVTTTDDLVHFLDALLAGELFEQAETLEEMLTFVEVTGSGDLVGYGLGIERYRVLDGVEVIGHEGGTAGYSALVGRLPAHEIDVAVVVTSPVDFAPVLIPALELMVAEAS